MLCYVFWSQVEYGIIYFILRTVGGSRDRVRILLALSKSAALKTLSLENSLPYWQ